MGKSLGWTIERYFLCSAGVGSFESSAGWPSLTKPFEPENIVEKQDRSLFMVPN
jgi:peptide methionine sulfoxide reductase MsrB